MNNETYLDVVVKVAYEKTLDGSLSWEITDHALSAQAHPLIRISIDYEDKGGPDEVQWKDVFLTHPVGKGVTMAFHPDSNMGRLAPSPISRQNFERIEEIFRRLLLEPRRKALETAMRELMASVDQKL